MLAILGERPARPKRIVPAFRADAATRERVAGLLDGGTLSDWYGGPWCRAFEERFAAAHGVGHAAAVNSGTAALHAALAAAGIGPGDEVILPSACFFTAAAAILQQNAIPILADCEPERLGVDPGLLDALLTPRTRALMVVHMYGYPSDIHALAAWARAHRLVLIEDCGQCLGAEVGGKKVGTFGDFGCFSLASPRKHISVGEGGVVTTANDDAAKALRRVVNKGKDNGWFTHRVMGYSYILPEFPAIVGLQGLSELEGEIERRRTAAAAYDRALEGTGMELEEVPADVRHVYFRKLVRLPVELTHLRDWFVAAVEAENVSAKPPHAPLHRIGWLMDREAYPRGCPFTCGHGRVIDYRAQTFPVTDRELDRIVDLETGPGLSAEQAEVSAAAVRRVWEFVRDRTEHAESLAEAYGAYGRASAPLPAAAAVA